MASAGMNILEQSLMLETLDRDLFRSKLLWTPKMARGTYGGQLIAHTVEAAASTVPAAFKVHSLHSNFLSAGNSSIPMYYRVRRLRDGASFANRLVVAQQDGKAVFVATINFHVDETPGIRHEHEMPKVPPPDEAVLEQELLDGIISQPEVASRLKEDLRRKMPEAKAMSIRYVNPNNRHTRSGIKSVEPQYVWMRSIPIDPSRPDLHRAIAAFMSDFSLAMSALAPHGFPNLNLEMLVSLDHTIHFHRTLRVDEWFLYKVWTTWADGNRALVHGQVYGSDQRLAMSVTQEVLVRTREGYLSVAKL